MSGPKHWSLIAVALLAIGVAAFGIAAAIKQHDARMIFDCLPERHRLGHALAAERRDARETADDVVRACRSLVREVKR